MKNASDLVEKNNWVNNNLVRFIYFFARKNTEIHFNYSFHFLLLQEQQSFAEHRQIQFCARLKVENEMEKSTMNL